MCFTGENYFRKIQHMAYLLFIDESGIDRHESPYEVVCGITIEDKDLWKFISAVKRIELDLFGMRYSSSSREIKGRKFLKTKVFKQAKLHPEFSEAESIGLVKDCLEKGAEAGTKQIAALAQAKLKYVKQLLELCSQFRIKIFAAISLSPVQEPVTESGLFLRKDYVYLFERFFYFLEDKRLDQQGIVVFDELDKSQSHILVEQLENYFKRTTKGRLRSGLVIPEPFFVHSDLTTGIQVADLMAYIISWSLRLKGMNKPAREELIQFSELIKPLRYRTTREIGTISEMEIWSIVFVK